MKNKDLIKLLQTLPPEMDVAVENYLGYVNIDIIKNVTIINNKNFDSYNYHSNNDLMQRDKSTGFKSILKKDFILLTNE